MASFAMAGPADSTLPSGLRRSILPSLDSSMPAAEAPSPTLLAAEEGSSSRLRSTCEVVADASSVLISGESSVLISGASLVVISDSHASISAGRGSAALLPAWPPTTRASTHCFTLSSARSLSLCSDPCLAAPLSASASELHSAAALTFAVPIIAATWVSMGEGEGEDEG